MARAVATLEGDSTSLVKAIKDAKTEMLGLEGGGKALSKQLKDVASEADKAAGSLVTKIGGGAAIKAIGGIGAAYKAAQMFVDELRVSSQALFQQNGKEGQAVFDDLSKSLDRSNSAFARAVLQTDDMYVAAGKMYAAWTLYNDAVDAAVDSTQTFLKYAKYMPQFWGVTLVSSLTGFTDAFNNTAKEGEARARDAAKAAGDVAAATKRIAPGATEVIKTVEGMESAYATLAGRTETLENKQKSQAISNIDNLMKQIEALALLQNQADNMSGDNVGGLTDAQLDKMNRLAKLKSDIQNKPPAAETKTPTGGGGGGESRAAKAKREAAEKEAARLAQEEKDKAALAARVAMFGQATDAEIAAFQAASERKTAIAQEQFNAARQLAIDTQDLTFNLTQSPEEYIAEEEKKSEAAKAKVAADTALRQTEYDARIAMFGQASTTEIDAYNATKDAKAAADQAEFDAARARAIELHDLTFNLNQTAAEFAAGERAKEKAAHDEKVNQLTAGFQEYGKLAGQQLADGEKAADVAEKLAKKALGGQISALGDKAMVEAAIYAAAFNPMAIPMAAAGVAAYTAAAYLGAEGKKATTATPASAAPAAAPVNTAFNLRVDAAFADGESIARQFAMMQRSAQSRGLVPAGA
jgi:hypothetical protein